MSDTTMTTQAMDQRTVLRDLTFELDLEAPDITNMPNKDKRLKKPTYLAKVKIGDKSWTSHPASFDTALEAEEEAIQKALKELTARKELLKQGTVFPVKPEDKVNLITNIEKIISEQPGGAKLMLHDAVALEYAKLFNSKLPKNWIELISDSDGKIVVEKQQLNNRIILIGLPNTTNTREKSQLSKENQTNGSTNRTQMVTNGNSATPTKVPVQPVAPFKSEFNKLTLNTALSNKASGDADVLRAGKPIPEADLPLVKPLPKAENDYFDVCVVLAATPYNFYVQAHNNLQAKSPFDNMKNEMQEFYNNDENKIELNPDLLVNSMFAAGKFNDTWYRVQIESVIQKNTTNMQFMCLFVDYGEMHVLELSSVQPLFTQFRNVPKQAIRASLARVQPIDGQDWNALTCYEFSKMVEGNSFVSTVLGVDWNDTGKDGAKSPVLKLALCDTNQDQDVYIDQVLVLKKYAKFTTSVA